MTTDEKQQPPRWLEYMPLDAIKPALVNPKGHDEPLINASVSRHGAADAPIIDERTGRLVGGHGRLDDAKARRDAGEEPPDGFMVGDDGAWLMGVQRGWRSKSDDDAHALGIALNQGTIAGGWKRDELAEVLSELRSRDPQNLIGTGYAEQDLDQLLASLGKSSSALDGFQPDPDAPTPRLDQLNPVVCPECGHSFHPAPTRR